MDRPAPCGTILCERRPCRVVDSKGVERPVDAPLLRQYVISCPPDGRGAATHDDSMRRGVRSKGMRATWPA